HREPPPPRPHPPPARPAQAPKGLPGLQLKLRRHRPRHPLRRPAIRLRPRRRRLCRHHAGRLRRRLPGRLLHGHDRQRRPLHLGRGGQARDRGPEDPRQHHERPHRLRGPEGPQGQRRLQPRPRPRRPHRLRLPALRPPPRPERRGRQEGPARVRLRRAEARLPLRAREPHHRLRRARPPPAASGPRARPRVHRQRRPRQGGRERHLRHQVRRPQPQHRHWRRWLFHPQRRGCRSQGLCLKRS
ncbi:hypothetical protein CCHR01_18850, partial [Colletotrichum chrysophilum]